MSYSKAASLMFRPGTIKYSLTYNCLPNIRPGLVNNKSAINLQRVKRYTINAYSCNENYYKYFGFGTIILSFTSVAISYNIIHNDDKKPTPQLVYGAQPFVKNNWQNIPDAQPNNTLKPDQSQATFEMGLYEASKNEMMENEFNYRNKRIRRKFTGWIFKIGFFLQDYCIEPIITFGRFIELSLIFIPVFTLYPIGFFGKMDKIGERSGARLWYWLLRHAAEMGGASFVKLGQWAASRTDIFSRGLCAELSKLHSNAKEHSFRATRKILKETFGGKELEEIFDEFSEKPTGCGAIAQVYLAKLKPQFVGDSEKDHDSLVAVKVVHPRVAKNISRDLKIMSFFANIIDIIPTMEWLSLPQEVEQFSILMNLQLDLRIESYNLYKFRDKFSKANDIVFPKPRFSSRKVLIEDRIYGVSMNKILDLKHFKNDKMLKYISDRLVDSFLKMMILDNFTHADLHPGNIFVRFVKSENLVNNTVNEFEADNLIQKLNQVDNSNELNDELSNLVSEKYLPQLCFIDAGLVTELDERNRFNFISLFNALAQFDGYKAGELMIERSKTPETAINKELFYIKVERLVNKVKERTFTLGAVSIGDLLDNMLSMVRSHHVRMEGDFVSIVVAILILEGICRQLDPDIDLFARWVFAWTIGFPTMQFD
ncbi:hypothetical protein C6P40_005168 [Pichia californica]|uniref:ABC1 atypical kinase-like domain-containing protein n=1 Tax=Pichia californica TaxID=460514 RepID=A0A9P6WLK0_9ASCO|nr:hypothetical protein C6P42_005436 [[Candida] californica]KAG0689346.1 hypothetical protein C6P40_005168 [[Candida] californica]